MYDENEMLMLSGIQHFMFCPRQWALMQLEQQWADNRLTLEGDILHARVDNPFYRQKNGDTITMHSVHIASRQLGLYGITDAVELLPSASLTDTITHSQYPGRWKPFPVEYKHGRPKKNNCDKMQLVAQVISLEEMYGIHIPEAALYYNEVKHRETVSITDELRRQAQQCADQMHQMCRSKKIPDARKMRGCKSCSLKDICMPETAQCPKVTNYLKCNLYEDFA